MKRRALVIGGSLGGLFAASLLLEQGWDVDICERAGDELASRGAGIGTHEELFGVLRRIGVAIDDSIGVRVADRICLDGAGRALHRIHWGRTMSGWSRIYRPLKDRFPADRCHFGRNYTGFEAVEGEVVARFDDGSEARADLLIGADGIRSAVRAQLVPGADPRYAGYIGWRGVVDERAMPRDMRARLETCYYFALPPGEMMVCYPVPGPGDDVSAGCRSWNYVWYRATRSEQELRDLCTGSDGRHYGTAIPPPLIRPEVAAGIKAVARDRVAPQIAALVELSQPFFQAIFDVESPIIALGRVVLLGDAAFVARPHLGIGVTKAALDALCLARSIEIAGSDLDAALARYQRLRGDFGRRCVARGRRIGAFIEARARPEAGWPPEALDQDPERLMREVGASIADIPELALEV
ncbi:MAG: FAD-dependent oxidoreductase [Betaproteobacteria bacterium]|nr:FAD-dependent oxidoreductase [Betaproteobacteria bacterium]